MTQRYVLKSSQDANQGLPTYFATRAPTCLRSSFPSLPTNALRGQGQAVIAAVWHSVRADFSAITPLTLRAQRLSYTPTDLATVLVGVVSRVPRLSANYFLQLFFSQFRFVLAPLDRLISSFIQRMTSIKWFLTSGTQFHQHLTAFGFSRLCLLWLASNHSGLILTTVKTRVINLEEKVIVA